MSKSMSIEDKRKLAEMMAPYLAWDLTRSELFSFRPSPDLSEAATETFISDIIMRLRRKIHEGQPFQVALIPQKVAACEQHRKLDEFHGLKKCDNPECGRLVTKGTAYCCGSCGSASSQYEIHEQGLLAHSTGCNERHRRRSCTTAATNKV